MRVTSAIVLAVVLIGVAVANNVNQMPKPSLTSQMINRMRADEQTPGAESRGMEKLMAGLFGGGGGGKKGGKKGKGGPPPPPPPMPYVAPAYSPPPSYGGGSSYGGGNSYGGGSSYGGGMGGGAGGMGGGPPGFGR